MAKHGAVFIFCLALILGISRASAAERVNLPTAMGLRSDGDLHVEAGQTTVLKNASAGRLVTTGLVSCVAVIVLDPANDVVLLSHVVAGESRYLEAEPVDAYVGFLRDSLRAHGGRLEGSRVVFVWGGVHQDRNAMFLTLFEEATAGDRLAGLSVENSVPPLAITKGAAIDLSSKRVFVLLPKEGLWNLDRVLSAPALFQP